MPWVDLYRQHRKLRGIGMGAVEEIRRTLARIASQHPSVFDRNVPARFQPVTAHGIGPRGYRLGQASGEAICSTNLAPADRERVQVSDARLQVMLLVDVDVGHLHELTVAVAGTQRDGQSWTLAVHLADDRVTDRNPDGDRQGLGACGHAALHCHVGPDVDIPPKVRAPLPPLPPGAVLEMVISQVLPIVAFEPAPWRAVPAVLNGSE